MATTRLSRPAESGIWQALGVCLLSLCASGAAGAQTPQPEAEPATVTVEYRLLSTSRTSTMEKEMNLAAESGFQFQAAMGGETAFGGNEVVVIMGRLSNASKRVSYRLLAATRTSTMQKELSAAGESGFEYRGQTVFKSAFGGDEVVVILEQNNDRASRSIDYKLLATSKTSTFEKELSTAGAAGYRLVGLTVSKTALGGQELVAITVREH